MNIYFTSDTHFNHANVIKFCDRPFKSVEEMNEAMVDGWNSAVSSRDVIYHLGDFTLGGIDEFDKWSSQLKGNIKILPGSHDHRWLKKFKNTDRIQVIAPLVSIEIPEIINGDYKQVLVMCHYSMRVWDRSHYGSWHLFGHSHGNLKGIGLSFDVGVDCTGFVPMSLEEVKSNMNNLERSSNE